MTYDLFLFYKIYQLHNDTGIYMDLGYDLEYAFILALYNRFLESEYNLTSKPLYECMEDFIKSI